MSLPFFPVFRQPSNNVSLATERRINRACDMIFAALCAHFWPFLAAATTSAIFAAECTPNLPARTCADAPNKYLAAKSVTNIVPMNGTSAGRPAPHCMATRFLRLEARLDEPPIWPGSCRLVGWGKGTKVSDENTAPIISINDTFIIVSSSSSSDCPKCLRNGLQEGFNEIDVS